jgi:hypothetical protein
MGPGELRGLAEDLRRAIDLGFGLALSSRAPAYGGRWRRLQEPRPGDLVAEVSTLYRDNAIDAVGRLTRVQQDPVDYGEGADPWDEAAEGRPHPTETVYYIRTLDGREMRWTNAKFVAAGPRR